MNASRTARAKPQAAARPADTDLKTLVEALHRRAQARGFISPKEVKQELAEAGVGEELWKEVVKSARPLLQYHGGRYYFVPGVSPRRHAHEEMHLQVRAWFQAVAQHQKRQAKGEERRGSERVTFVQPVSLTLESGETHRVMSKDLSPSGIRFIGTRNLLGQKVKATLASPNGRSCTFSIRILWACEVGDGLYENGGIFLEMSPQR